MGRPTLLVILILMATHFTELCPYFLDIYTNIHVEHMSVQQEQNFYSDSDIDICV